MLTAKPHNGRKFAYLVVCFFGFLGPEDLVIASTICYAWGKLVHDRSLSSFKPMITSEFEEIDLFGTNNMYTRIPLSVFERITSLFFKFYWHKKEKSFTDIQVIKTTTFECVKLQIPGRQNFILWKEYLGELVDLDHSHNNQITVLGLACLCSYSALHHIQIYGLKGTSAFDQDIFQSYEKCM